MNAQAKTINLLLYNKTLDGVLSITEPGWNHGELFYSPRSAASELLKMDALANNGIYISISDNAAAIGSSADFDEFLDNSIDQWNAVVILTTKDDTFSPSDIVYIEEIITDKIQRTWLFNIKSAAMKRTSKIDKFRKAELEQYIDEALFLMRLIGIRPLDKLNTVNINDATVKLSLGKRAKADAVQFVENSGITLEKKNTNYSVIQKGKGCFWINPNISCLSKNWNIILNNTESSELIVLFIPENKLTIKTRSQKGLITRHDQPLRIDIKIDASTLLDIVSKTDFSSFVVKRIKYKSSS